MINIFGFWENYKTQLKEKRDAYWINFKSKLPQNVQSFVDIIERLYIKFNLGELINTIVFVVVMVIIIRFFIGEIRWIPSGSMRPTLIEGDRIVVERYSRFFTAPKRGDIMVFYPPSTELSRKFLPLFERLTGIFCKDVAYIKRVVGVPGDKIEIKEEFNGAAYVYINDQKYEEDYIKSVYEYPKCPKESSDTEYLVLQGIMPMQCGPFYLSEKEFFMMGDNRGNSQDSRYWGVLNQDRFVGRAVVVFWPLDRIKILHRLKPANK
ncbi:signal peptidase I [bacterium]|nr:signal peptidase I [bacterium]